MSTDDVNIATQTRDTLLAAINRRSPLAPNATTLLRLAEAYAWCVAPGPGSRGGREELSRRHAAPRCAGARGGAEDPLGGALLHDAALLHHRDPLGQPAHRAEVVGDQQVGEARATPAARTADARSGRRCRGPVTRAARPAPAGAGRGPARRAMATRWRSPPESSAGRRAADGADQADRLRAGAVTRSRHLGAPERALHLERLGHGGADRQPGVEAEVGVLEDDLHRAPQGRQVAPAGAGARRCPSTTHAARRRARPGAPGCAPACSCRCPTPPPGPPPHPGPRSGRRRRGPAPARRRGARRRCAPPRGPRAAAARPRAPPAPSGRASRGAWAGGWPGPPPRCGPRASRRPGRRSAPPTPCRARSAAPRAPTRRGGGRSGRAPRPGGSHRATPWARRPAARPAPARAPWRSSPAGAGRPRGGAGSRRDRRPPRPGPAAARRRASARPEAPCARRVSASWSPTRAHRIERRRPDPAVMRAMPAPAHRAASPRPAARRRAGPAARRRRTRGARAAGTRPISASAVRVLPAPLSPTSASTSPGARSRSTPSTSASPPGRRDAQAAGLEDGAHRVHLRASGVQADRGSRASRTASPMRLTASTVSEHHQPGEEGEPGAVLDGVLGADHQGAPRRPAVGVECPATGTTARSR